MSVVLAGHDGVWDGASDTEPKSRHSAGGWTVEDKECLTLRSEAKSKKKKRVLGRWGMWHGLWSERFRLQWNRNVTLWSRFLRLKWKRERWMSDFRHKIDRILDKILNVGRRKCAVCFKQLIRWILQNKQRRRWCHPNRGTGLQSVTGYIQSMYHFICYYNFHIKGLIEFLYVYSVLFWYQL